MRKLIFAISFLAAASSSAFADPVADRQALMKANGAAMRDLTAFVKGDKAYDAAEVLALLTKLNEDAVKMTSPDLWPAGSNTGDSTAAPNIWEDAAAYTAALEKFEADTASAVATAPADVDALQVQMGVVGPNCASCHQTFRIKKG